MKIDRRSCLLSLAAGGAAGLLGASPRAALPQEAAAKAAAAARFVRFEKNGRAAYGAIHEKEEKVRELRAPPFESRDETGAVHDLKGLKLLFPCEPSKILAMAGNYKSHLQDQTPPKNPEAFFKPPSALLENGGTIVLPRGSADVHYEGELVVVIGKKASRVSRADAPKHIFGYTCGNDVSARDWQKNDRQWWRAKGCDTFAALGPWIAASPGFNAGDVLLTTKLNGKEVQRARTSELIYDAAAIVSFLSDHVTLLPGDLIYTGTPGTTSAMKPGDVVEVEIEGIGVLRNPVG